MDDLSKNGLRVSRYNREERKTAREIIPIITNKRSSPSRLCGIGIKSGSD
jgi:hypothetical protein